MLALLRDGLWVLPPSRYYKVIFGLHDTDTLIVEREWESFTALEEAASKATADPERQKLKEESPGIFLTIQYEAYSVLG